MMVDAGTSSVCGNEGRIIFPALTLRVQFSARDLCPLTPPDGFLRAQSKMPAVLFCSPRMWRRRYTMVSETKSRG